MPESLTLTTTLELPVVMSHACGAETFCIHHCWGKSGSFGVTLRNVRPSSDSKEGRAQPRPDVACCVASRSEVIGVRMACNPFAEVDQQLRKRCLAAICLI